MCLVMTPLAKKKGGIATLCIFTIRIQKNFRVQSTGRLNLCLIT